MDFFKANDVLKGLRVSAAPTEAEKTALRRDKLEACKIVVDHLFTSQVMAMPEYPRLLCAVLDSLYCAHGDSDTNVWMVADESITRLIRLSTPTYSEFLCFELMQVLMRRVSFLPSLRSIKSAFKKFADICGCLRPSRARRYVDALVALLQDFARSRDESLLEAVAGSIGTVLRTFAFYLAPAQAARVEATFVPLLGDPQAVVRRAAAVCVTALAEHAPVPRHALLVRTLLDNVARASSVTTTAAAAAAAAPAAAQDEKEKEEKKEKKETGDRAALQHGTLLAFLQLVRMRRGFDDDGAGGALGPVARDVLLFCQQSLRDYAADLTVYGAALEVVSQLLQARDTSDTDDYDVSSSSIGTDDDGDSDSAADRPLCAALWTRDMAGVWRALGAEFAAVVRDPAARVSSKAVAVGCLALLYRRAPDMCYDILFRPATTTSSNSKIDKEDKDSSGKNEEDEKEEKEGDEVEEEEAVDSSFMDMVLESFERGGDPLLRGQYCVLLGEVVGAHLRRKEAARLQRVCDARAAVAAMVATFRGRSSVSARMSCAALRACVGALLRADDAALRRTALTVVAAFLGTPTDAYWLVRLEAAHALARVDYRALAALERTRPDTPPRAGSTQAQAVRFVVDMLAAPDARVRRGAAAALVTLAAHLWLPAHLDAPMPLADSTSSGSSTSTGSNYDHSNDSSSISSISSISISSRDDANSVDGDSDGDGTLWPSNAATRHHRGIAYVMQLLVDRTLLQHPLAGLKGVYHALLAMTRAYGYLGAADCATGGTAGGTGSGTAGGGGAALAHGVQEGNANPLCAYAPDVLPLVAERLAGSPLALDLECHADMLALACNLGRAGRAHFDVFAPALLRHGLRMLNIICFVAENRAPPPPPRDARAGHAYFAPSKATAAFVGTFRASQPYIDIFFRLHAAFAASLGAGSGGGSSSSSSSSGSSSSIAGGDGGGDAPGPADRFGELRAVVLRTLAVVVQTVGPAIAAHTEELMFYLLKLFPCAPVPVLTCAQELFRALYVCPQTTASAGAASASGSGARALPPPDAEGIFTAWNMARFEYPASKIRGTDAATLALLRHFQPLVKLAMEMYVATTDGAVKAAVLAYLTEMLRGGISYDHLDRDSVFLRAVMAQLGTVLPQQASPSPAAAAAAAEGDAKGGRKAPVPAATGASTRGAATAQAAAVPAAPFVPYFAHPVTTLPALVEFLHVLFVVRGWSEPGLVDAEVLLRLARLPALSSSSSSASSASSSVSEGGSRGVSWNAVFRALTRSVPALFTDAARVPHVEQYRNALFNQTIARFPHPRALRLATVFLYHARVHGASWEMYSRAASIAALPHLRRPRLAAFRDLWRVCALGAAMHPAGFIRNAWGAMVLSPPPLEVSLSSSSSTPVNSRGDAKVPSASLDDVLAALGLAWLPGFVVAARQAGSADYDTLIAAIHYELRKPEASSTSSTSSSATTGATASEGEGTDDFDGGSSSRYEDAIFGAAVRAVTQTCAQTRRALSFAGVARTACLLVRAATALLERMAPYCTRVQPSVTAALAALAAPAHPFRALLAHSSTPRAVADAVCRFVRVLCTLASTQQPAIALYSSLLLDVLGPVPLPLPLISTDSTSDSTSESNSDNSDTVSAPVSPELVRPSVGTRRLLRELCHYLALTHGDAGALAPAVLVAVVRHGGAAPFLRAVVRDPAHARAVLAAAQLCLEPCVTQRGIAAHLALLGAVAPSPALLAALVARLDRCAAPALRTGTEQLFVRTLAALQAAPQTALAAPQLAALLAQIDAGTHGRAAAFTEARRALHRHLALSPPVVPAPQPHLLPSDGDGAEGGVGVDAEARLATVAPGEVVAYAVSRLQHAPLAESVRFVPLMYSLGAAHFAALLRTGDLDWVLAEYLDATPMNELFACSLGPADRHAVAAIICTYLCENIRALLQEGTATTSESTTTGSAEEEKGNSDDNDGTAAGEGTCLCTHAWQRRVYLAQSVAAALLRHRALVVGAGTGVGAADLVDMGARLLAQFLVQWAHRACSPFDLVPVFRFVTLALFDLDVSACSSSSSGRGAGEVDALPPCVARLVPPLFRVFQITVLSQNLQAAALIDAAVARPGLDARARVRTMLHGLIAGVLVGDLAWDCHFGKSFADSVLTMLLTLARCFPALLFPTLPQRPQGQQGQQAQQQEGACGYGNDGDGDEEGAALDPLAMLEMPVFALVQQQESPELALRLSLFFLTTVGLQSPRHFLEVHGSLRALLTAPDPASLGISEELRCLALRALTAMLLRACLGDDTAQRLRTVLATPSYAYQREYGVRRANNVNRVLPLHEVIVSALERLRNETSPVVPVDHAIIAADDTSDSNTSSSSTTTTSDAPQSQQPQQPQQEPQHPLADLAQARRDGTLPVALWAFSDVAREDRPGKYSFEQVALSTLRAPERRLQWRGVNISVMVSELFGIVESIMCVPDDSLPHQDGSSTSTSSSSISSNSISTSGSDSAAGAAAAAGAGQEAAAGQQQQQQKDGVSALTGALLHYTQLQAEAVYALVLLSDLFTVDQFAWMHSTFRRMYSALCADATDCVLMSNLVFGLLKSAAVLDIGAVPAGASPETIARAAADVAFLHDVVKYAFGARNGGGSSGNSSSSDSGSGTPLKTRSTSLVVAGVVGVSYLITSRAAPRVLTPDFVLAVARFLLAELGGAGAGAGAVDERTLLHVMSCAFALVTAFPRDCESCGFTRALFNTLTARVNQRDCSIVTAQAVYRGLGALLTSQSLAPELRADVDAFALRKLQHPTHAFNSAKSFFALGLLLSSMYSGPAPELLSRGATTATGTSAASSSSFAASAAASDSSAVGGAPEMSQLERVQTLFTNLRRGMFSQHTPALVELMALLIVDTFRPDQALSFVLGEFAKHRSNHETVAFIMNRVFELLPDKTLLTTWVAICAASFLQRKTKALWSLTCVLLACAPAPLLHGLFPLVAASARDDPDLFVLACAEFCCDPRVADQACRDMLAAVQAHATPHPQQPGSPAILAACAKIAALVPALTARRAQALKDFHHSS